MMKVCIPCNKMALISVQFLVLIDVHGMLDDLQRSSFDSSLSFSEPSQSSETVNGRQGNTISGMLTIIQH